MRIKQRYSNECAHLYMIGGVLTCAARYNGYPCKHCADLANDEPVDLTPGEGDEDRAEHEARVRLLEQ